MTHNRNGTKKLKGAFMLRKQERLQREVQTHPQICKENCCKLHYFGEKKKIENCQYKENVKDGGDSYFLEILPLASYPR